MRKLVVLASSFSSVKASDLNPHELDNVRMLLVSDKMEKKKEREGEREKEREGQRNCMKPKAHHTSFLGSDSVNICLIFSLAS